MKSKRVLIVDDEPGIRNLFADVLKRRGYEVVTAPDGNSAVACAASNSIGLAFLDMRMPGIDGLETLKKLKEVCPGLKVAMMTGAAAGDRVSRALESGAFVCLCKPFGVTDIIQTVEILELLDEAA